MFDSPRRAAAAGLPAAALAATLAAAAAPAPDALGIRIGGSLGAQQATTTGAVRGAVAGPDGRPAPGVTVTAVDQARGVRRGAVTDEQGRYQLPFLAPGTYTLRAQRIGLRPVERRDVRVGLGAVERFDVRLESAPTELSAVTVTAAGAPLIDAQKTGASTRIDERQILTLPTNGRNFKDLVVLTPGVSATGATGAGGGQSIGGGRTGASNLLMDGANNNEQFFGGDARGGDRAPFSYSIEAVKEIQVITAGYDVERGNFTGGTVNAVTKSGTNKFSGAVFNFTRQDELAGVRLTGDDFLGARPLDFRSRQYGAALGGPVVRDRAHFFATFDRQERRDPRFVLNGAAVTPGAAGFRFTRAVLDSITGAAQRNLGYPLAALAGNFPQDVNESAAFARVDWQLNDANTLTLRNNFVDFVQRNDRLATALGGSADFQDNAGPYRTRSNSTVASLESSVGRLFGGALTNEARAQYAFEDKPRPANPTALGGPLPQVTVLYTGTAGVNFGSDPVLHANVLNTRNLELIDNLRLALGAHTLKVGGTYNRVHVYNDFFNNSLGTYTYNSVADFAANRPARFTRALRYPGRGNPVADFAAYEVAAYAQDEWQATPRLFVSYGLRWDGAGYPTRPAENDSVFRAFGLRTDKSPRDFDNVSPRLGFTYDLGGGGRTLLRGGTGLFFGRTPYVFMGNAFSNTGQSQLTLDCRGSEVPAPNLAAFAADPSAIPTACASGAARTSGVPSVNVFSPDFQQSYAWKSNVGLDREVARGWRVGVEAVASRVRANYLVTDANLNTTPRFTADGRLPVFAPVTSVTPATAVIPLTATRRNAAFGNVFVQNSEGYTNSFQGTASVTGRLRRVNLQASYTYDRTRDNGSVSCCIAGADVFNATRTVGDPNDLGAQYGFSDFQRTHQVIVSPSVTLPFGVTLSGIYRGFSGRPWTARYGADVNGDGAANDRLAVPTADELAAFRFAGTAAQQQAARDTVSAKVARFACLTDARGGFAARNACRNPWQNVLDARAQKAVRTFRGQQLELVADFFNVLNGLSAKWGRQQEVSPADQALLTPVGFDPAAQRYTYRANSTFGTATPTQFTLTQQFQVQLGARYAF